MIEIKPIDNTNGLEFIWDPTTLQIKVKYTATISIDNIAEESLRSTLSEKFCRLFNNTSDSEKELLKIDEVVREVMRTINGIPKLPYDELASIPMTYPNAIYPSNKVMKNEVITGYGTGRGQNTGSI